MVIENKKRSSGDFQEMQGKESKGWWWRRIAVIDGLRGPLVLTTLEALRPPRKVLSLISTEMHVDTMGSLISSFC
jgi:hypothetical protein